MKRYILHERLGEGGMGVVFRATDRLNGTVVALKQVTLPTDQLSFASQTSDPNLEIALAHEFRILASLRHPHIISVLDYGFDDAHHPFFTMRLIEESQPITQGTHAFSASSRYFTQMLQALAYLHRRGMVHRDLKPSNVMIEHDQVIVLDFGLSIEREHATGIQGTLQYMAPELLEGHPASEASDLYAVGLVVYEMFTGIPAIDGKTAMHIIQTILDGAINFDRLQIALAAHIPHAQATELTAVIQRLTAKTATDRYPTAEAVLHDLYPLLGNGHSPEPDPIRESFLQAAHFTGRDSELQQLATALSDLITTKHGGVWLVGGESGIGKSRLLDELWTRGLVQGALSLRGYAIREGGKPYHVWQTVLQRACLETDLDPSEASILKSLLPDIARLVGYEVAEPPELNPDAARLRLFNVCERILARQIHPILILLEDVHWADSGSLALLKHLAAQSLPMMIVASFRDDEPTAIRSLLPEAHLISLKRFSRPAITKLSQSMLGKEVAKRSEVIELVERETEGNVFFIIEVIRTLAEEAGKLNMIGQVTLPAHVFSGGMKMVVRRRLQRAPASAQPFLRMAAIAGRQLDLTLLTHLCGDIEAWLEACAEAAVLEVQGDRWHFSHDKLREELLDTLTPDEHITYHRQVAIGLEAVAPEQVSALVHHWAAVGDTAKELHYTILACDQALLNGSYNETIHFALRALEIGPSLTVVQRAHLERQIGESYYRVGRPQLALEHFARLLTMLNRPIPRSWARGTLTQLLLQLWHRFRLDLLRWPFRHPAYEDDYALSAIRGCARSALLYLYNNETLPFFYFALQSTNIAERSRLRHEQARRYGVLSYATATIPLHRVTRHYLALARQAISEVENFDVQSSIAVADGTYSMLLGNWQHAEERLRFAIELNRQTGYLHAQDEAHLTLPFVYRYQGDWDKEDDLWQKYRVEAAKIGNFQGESAALRGMALNALRRGHLDEALKLINQVHAIPDQYKDRSDLVMIFGVTALIHWSSGDEAQAKSFAERGLALIREHPPYLWAAFDGYAAIAETMLICWEKDPTWRNTAREVCKYFHDFAKPIVICQPRSITYQAWCNWLDGKPRRAEKQIRHAIKEAARLGMKFDEGLGYYYAAKWWHNPDDSERANAILYDLGAKLYL